MLILFLSSVAAALASAAELKIDASAHVDRAKLDTSEQNKLSYNITLGADGNYIHVLADGMQTAVPRQMNGGYTLKSLGQGSHEICINIVNRTHVPVGVTVAIQ